MPSPYHGIHPPFRLPSNVVLFHDWRYVNTGTVRWHTEDGSGVPLFATEPHPPVRLDTPLLPTGIRLRAQMAEKSEPVISAGADEIMLFGGSLIREGGMYRLWAESWPIDTFESSRGGEHNLVRYFESDDGVEWRAPKLGVIERNGSRANNIVYGAPMTGDSVGYHGGCVFLDPSASPSERYKAWHLGLVQEEKAKRWVAKRPWAADMNRPLASARGLYGATSPDGISWTPIPEPMVLQSSDTQNVCAYDVVRKAYVAYCRTWFFHRRTIGRMESPTFSDFPLPEEVLWPSAAMEPHDLWYNNAKTIMPGTVDYHVMFPMRWRLVGDSFDFHLATSPDGIIWQVLPGGPVCEPGPAGAWDQGVVVPGVGLVDLPGDRTGMLIEGSPVPHKHPRVAPLGKLAWATWPRERLAALEAPEHGFFATWPLAFDGRTVVLNLKTSFAGHVRVAACDGSGRPLPGRGFDDCDIVSGDTARRTVTWHGEADIGHAEGAPVMLQFQLREASLYSIRFE